MTATDEWSRVFVSAFPLSGAVSCRLVAYEVDHAARPAITWSELPLEYSVGQGCSKAVVTGASRSLTMAVQGRVYGDLSYTVMEVG
ncbi:hypothetical protein D3C73_1508590 [compost metagenome]